MRDPGGADRDPRIARALIVAAVRGVAPGTERERGGDRRPRTARVEGDAREQPGRAALGIAVLLPDGDEVGRIEGVDGEGRLDLDGSANARGDARCPVGCLVTPILQHASACLLQNQGIEVLARAFLHAA